MRSLTTIGCEMKKALVDRKSANNMNINNNNKNYVRGHWGPVSGCKNYTVENSHKLGRERPVVGVNLIGRIA